MLLNVDRTNCFLIAFTYFLGNIEITKLKQKKSYLAWKHLVWMKKIRMSQLLTKSAPVLLNYNKRINA